MITNFSSWMSCIDNDVNISTLAIPGTHNSAACFRLSAPSVQCQGKSILDQLKHGVRFLDIRLSKDYMSRAEKVNDLIIVHGKFPVKLSGNYKFKNLLKDVYAFLASNPSETILISIKLENTMLNWNEKMDEFAKVLFEKYIAHDRAYWYLSDQIPTLKYCRGKAVLLRRFPVIENGVYKKFGIPSMWNYSNDVYMGDSVCVQDCCMVKNPTDIEKKIGLIKDMMCKAKDYHGNNIQITCTGSSESLLDSNPSSISSALSSSPSSNSSYPRALPPKLFINFCSGANYLNKSFWPSKVNKAIRKFNIDQHYSKNCGILVMDFAEGEDWKLVKNLVQVNF